LAIVKAIAANSALKG
jgi:hypothetical protein